MMPSGRTEYVPGRPAIRIRLDDDFPFTVTLSLP